ncbi:hypothetical protein [Marinicella sp. W31]|uniref:hypothetical protein n=1 Tax=Marinicella sp. W31 TaxID=3023713 RepID=UPI0037565777
MNKKNLLMLTATLLSAPYVDAEPIDFSASVGLEFRGFLQDPLFDRQGNGIQPSLFAEPEIKWRSDDRKHRFSFIGFARKDEQDSERTHVDIRELYWSYQSGNWTTTLGINKVFWGVTESVHLVDVINQTDLVEDLDQEDKLGQPMIHFSNQQDWGRLELFILPYFRERTFPGLDGRFSFGIDIDEDNPIYESGDDEKHVDLALRYSHYIGDVDIGLHVFEGTNREPRFVPSDDFSQLRPVYDQMTQFGTDVQYTREAWLWKLEAIHRDTRVDDFWAAVGGVEYTFYQVFESDADLGLLVEYQYDDRNPASSPTIADNDVFVAARYALNDTQDTSILAGIVMDTDNDTKFINIEAERRIGENLSAELRIRAFTDVDETDFASAFSQDDYAQLSLSWYF